MASIGGSRKVSVVCSGRVLDRQINGIAALSALPVIVDLEVICSLREAVTICEIVDGISNVEPVDDGSVDVSGSGGGRSRGPRVDEVVGRRGLADLTRTR